MELYGISGGRVHKHDTCINTSAKTRTKNVRNIYAMYGTKFNCLFGISVLSIDKRSEMFSQLLSVAPIVRSLLEIMLSIPRDFYHLTCEI